MTRFRNPIPVAKKILIGLFRLGSTSELRVAAQLFGVGISTVAGIQHQFTAAIIKHFGNKVHWPSTDEELLKISEDFARIWDYPLCIGSVDGCHIPCSPKAADATDFYNYKGWYSTILFAVADASYKFIYFNVGCPGRMNDGFIFRRSALKEIFRPGTNLHFVVAVTSLTLFCYVMPLDTRTETNRNVRNLFEHMPKQTIPS